METSVGDFCLNWIIRGVAMTLRESFLTVIYKKTGKIFTFNIDELVKSRKLGDTVKNSRCKARKSLGMRRT